jgi:DNA-binding CsgD family transcriptional regulator
MKSIRCSALTPHHSTSEKLLGLIDSSQKLKGYFGVSQKDLIRYIKRNNSCLHVIFHQPNYIESEIVNPTVLKHLGNVYVVLITNTFQPTFSCMFQKYLFSGIISMQELNELDVFTLIGKIKELGYYPNQHINEQQWEKFKSIPNPKPTPLLSPKEFELIGLLCNGYQIIQVMDKMRIGKSRVNFLIKEVKQKLSCISISEITNICIINKWITVTPETYARNHPFISSN